VNPSSVLARGRHRCPSGPFPRSTENPTQIVGEQTQMANTITSLKNFLQERHLTRTDPRHPVLRARQHLEKSEFLKTMRQICASINAQAGTVVVDEHQYLPPEPAISSFAFSNGTTEYVMRLEIWNQKSSLVFVTRKWRDSSASGFLRWVYTLAEVEPLSVKFKYSCEIEKDDPSLQEIAKCFYFLLSGLNHRYRPSFRLSNDSSRA
jgi:hypothetical protein